MKRITLVVLPLLLLWAVSLSATEITPAVEYSTTGLGYDSRPFTLGYEFTTSTAFSINALGYWNDGNQNNHQVGIWDSQGNLLVSTTVLGTDQVDGHFIYHPIDNFFLAPGTYVIGGEFLGNGNAFPWNANGVVTIAGYTYVMDEQLFGSGLNFPTVGNIGYGDNGILAANFSITDVTPVPEPCSLALLGSGMAGLFGMRKRWMR